MISIGSPGSGSALATVLLRADAIAVPADLANKELSAHFHLPEDSVKAVLRLFAITGVRTRAQLLRIALQHRFETDPPPRNETTPPA